VRARALVCVRHVGFTIHILQTKSLWFRCRLERCRQQQLVRVLNEANSLSRATAKSESRMSICAFLFLLMTSCVSTTTPGKFDHCLLASFIWCDARRLQRVVEEDESRWWRIVLLWQTAWSSSESTLAASSNGHQARCDGHETRRSHLVGLVSRLDGAVGHAKLLSW
jgi:hypothetical protein